MNAYEQKLDARRARLEGAADRAEAKSNQAYELADLREEKSGMRCERCRRGWRLRMWVRR